MLSAAPFAPPNEGPVPFRRDKIPMNIEEIRDMSENVAKLAAIEDGQSAESRRAAAQMVAVSLALNPVNREARGMLSDFSSGRFGKSRPKDGVGSVRDQLAKQLDWLQAAVAGKDANALSDCLNDVIRGGGDSNEEKGKWSGWVPELAAYSFKTPDPKPDEPSTDPFDQPPSRPDRDPNERPDPSGSGRFALKLDKAGVITPIWHMDNQGRWALKPSLIEMRAVYDKDSSDSFSLALGESHISERWDNYAGWIRGILEKRLEQLPKGLRVNVAGDKFVESLNSGRSQAISAPVAILANAAISGEETAGIVIGKLSEDGEFLPPSEFWPKLKAFGKGNGERMVLPTDGSEYVDAMLAFEKPEFFLEYEVVYAKSFDELIAATRKDAEGDKAKAREMFALIQKHADQNNVRRYIANTHIKKRLAEVVKLDPNHASAKMLLMQSNGDRPTRISRKVLAAEIQRITEPVNSIRALQYYELEEGLVKRPDAKSVYDACDEPLDGLERYIDRNDRELFKQAQDVLDKVRELDRAVGSRDSWHEVISGISQSSREVAAANSALQETLKATLKD